MDLRNITKITRNMTLYKNTINRGKEYLNDTEFEIVRYVTKHEERSLVEVANYLNVDKGLVTRMYKKLVGLGYLEVKSDENDSRKKILVATPKAKELPKEITYPTDIDRELLKYCKNIAIPIQKITSYADGNKEKFNLCCRAGI